MDTGEFQTYVISQFDDVRSMINEIVARVTDLNKKISEIEKQNSNEIVERISRQSMEEMARR